jgi:hypothetical protein
MLGFKSYKRPLSLPEVVAPAPLPDLPYASEPPSRETNANAPMATNAPTPSGTCQFGNLTGSRGQPAPAAGQPAPAAPAAPQGSDGTTVIDGVKIRRLD